MKGRKGKTLDFRVPLTPEALHAIELATFKAHLKEEIFDQSSDDTSRKAADRAVAQLINAGKIGHLGKFLWRL